MEEKGKHPDENKKDENKKMTDSLIRYGLLNASLISALIAAEIPDDRQLSLVADFFNMISTNLTYILDFRVKCGDGR